VVVPIERIERKIYLIRNVKVMLDRDLADLYEVETRMLIQAVRRHIKRFPDDFMFQLNKEEFNNLKSQIMISRWGGLSKFKNWRSQIVMSNSIKMDLRVAGKLINQAAHSNDKKVLNLKTLK